MPCTMKEILEDSKLFDDKFCGKWTKHHLWSVPVEGLRLAVKMIHMASNFPAVRSIEFYTPQGSEQPVVVFGKLNNALNMMQPRFGLTTRIDALNENSGTRLYFWVAERAIVDLGLTQEHKNLIMSWSPWRHGYGGRNIDTKCRAMPIPLWQNENTNGINDSTISLALTMAAEDDRMAATAIPNAASVANASGEQENARQSLKAMVVFLKAVGKSKKLRPTRFDQQRQEGINQICNNLDLVELCITPRVVESCKL